MADTSFLKQAFLPDFQPSPAHKVQPLPMPVSDLPSWLKPVINPSPTDHVTTINLSAKKVTSTNSTRNLALLKKITQQKANVYQDKNH